MRCPLSEANLIHFKQRISPLTLDTPVSDLIDWFYTGLQVLSEYDNM
jgi:hypothetical protein